MNQTHATHSGPPKIYQDDDAAYEAAMKFFGDATETGSLPELPSDDTHGGVPGTYPDDDASYDAAMEYFGGTSQNKSTILVTFK